MMRRWNQALASVALSSLASLSACSAPVQQMTGPATPHVSNMGVPIGGVQSVGGFQPLGGSQPLGSQAVMPTGNLSAPGNLPPARPVPGVALAFDYPGTFSRTSPAAVAVRLKVQTSVFTGRSQVLVQGQVHSLKGSRAAVPFSQSANLSLDGTIDFSLSGLQQETIYRIDSLSVADPQNQANALTTDDSYYAMTGGTTPLAEARRQLVEKAVAEAYDWSHNNYDRSKGYTLNAPGGWCDQFYTWALNGIFNVQYPDDYAPDWYSSNNALLSGTQILPTASRESISGDMIRMFDHTFMILSYDADENALWTVEGNFNDEVELYERSINTGWRFGHLTPNLLLH